MRAAGFRSRPHRGPLPGLSGGPSWLRTPLRRRRNRHAKRRPYAQGHLQAEPARSCAEPPSRPRRCQPGAVSALPAPLSAPGWTRTSNPRLRRPALYPVELRGRRTRRTGRPAHLHRLGARRIALDRRERNRDMNLAPLDRKSVKVRAVSTVEDDEQDLTRKQRREQAREQRKALEEAEAASAQRRKRLIQLGAVVAAVAVIIVVILVATGGGSKGGIEKTATTGGTSTTPKVVTEVSSLLDGIPQGGTTLGSPKAPVTMQYFADLECPICRQFSEGALKPLIEKYVRPGKLRIEYRNLETA